jgi:hypothetical protein
MKAHLISTAILIGIIILCIGMVMSKFVLMVFMGTALLVFAYSCVYLAVIRNMNDRNGKNKI